MTLWDNLINKSKPVIKQAQKKYTFASPAFVEAFTKVANELGCADEEIRVHLDSLEENYLEQKQWLHH